MEDIERSNDHTVDMNIATQRYAPFIFDGLYCLTGLSRLAVLKG